MKKYSFKLPEVKKIGEASAEQPINWLDTQTFPVYAYIPKECETESLSPMGDYTELECAPEDM